MFVTPFGMSYVAITVGLASELFEDICQTRIPSNLKSCPNAVFTQSKPTGSVPQTRRMPLSRGCTNTEGLGGGGQMSKLRSKTSCATSSLLFMSEIEESRSVPCPTMIAIVTSCESPG